MTDNHLPPRLEEIVEDFQWLEGREKLEYLLQFAHELPPLPEWLEGRQAEMDQVHECMTPVFIHLDEDEDGLRYYIDVPPESPTVRGYAEILRQGTEGASREEVLAIPHEFYLEMGLQKVLSGQRVNGIGAILRHMQALARTPEEHSA